MSPAPARAAICDRRDCPAPAHRVVMFHGQDFYFCGHHAVELARCFDAPDAAGASGATVEADGPALPAQLASAGVLALGEPT